jgi:hypothetical protein
VPDVGTTVRLFFPATRISLGRRVAAA